MELAKMIVETSFDAVGKKFGVSGNAIKKWCKDYEMPIGKEQLKQWYCKIVHTEYVPPQSQREKEPWMRPVNQIDLTSGEIINTFKSIKEANQSLNLKYKGFSSK